MANEYETLYAFNRADSTALLRTIGKDGATTGTNGNATDLGYDIRLGVTTGTITARSGATLGSGPVQWKKISSSGVASTQTMQTPSGGVSGVTAYNAGASIASGAYVICFRVGNKWIAVEVCS